MAVTLPSPRCLFLLLFSFIPLRNVTSCISADDMRSAGTTHTAWTTHYKSGISISRVDSEHADPFCRSSLSIMAQARS
ncbi:hypothetical protein GGI43DRAFT_401333 [Trichoderma evansii]